MKAKESKGVTLIALVVTIIVLIILSAITIAALKKDNGIITESNKAAEETEIAEEKEALNSSIVKGISQDRLARLKEDNFKIGLDEYIGEGKYELEYDNETKIFKVTFIESGRTYPVNSDGDISEENRNDNNNENGGDNGNDNQPDNPTPPQKEIPGLVIGENVTFTSNPPGWTNEIVNVTVTTTEAGYTIQTSKDETTWGTSNPLEFSENGKMYARLYDGKNAGSATTPPYNVGNIDKVAPIVSTALSGTTTSNSMTLSVGVTDTLSGLSSITWYYKLSSASSYTNAGTDTYTAQKGSTAGDTTAVTKTKKISNLPSGTYNCYVVITDVAGNTTSTETNSTEITLEVIPTPSGASASPTSWTNGNVTITLPTQSGYTTQYQNGSTSGTWSTYNSSSKPTISANTTVYYRYSDGTNVGSHGSLGITNIDKTKPVVTVATPSTSSIAITATDEASGIIGWTVTTSTTEPTSGFTTVTNTKSLSVSKTGLTQNTQYYVWVKDEAGNVSTSKAAKTTSIPTPSGASASPTSWTKGNVTITLPTQSGYTTQYQNGSTSGTWLTYNSSSKPTISANTTVYYRYSDGTNVGSYGSLGITNIDKVAPNVSNVTSTSTGVTITASDSASGIAGYAVTTSNTAPTSFVTSASITGILPNKTYYAWAKDRAGNVSASKSFTSANMYTTVSGTTVKMDYENTFTYRNLQEAHVDVIISNSISGSVSWNTGDGYARLKSSQTPLSSKINNLSYNNHRSTQTFTNNLGAIKTSTVSICSGLTETVTYTFVSESNGYITAKVNIQLEWTGVNPKWTVANTSSLIHTFDENLPLSLSVGIGAGEQNSDGDGWTEYDCSHSDIHTVTIDRTIFNNLAS